MPETLLGIDVGVRSVRIARMDWHALRKPEFLGFAEAPIAQDEERPFIQRAADAVRAALGGPPAPGAKIAVAAGGDRAYTRVFTLPFKGKRQVQLTAGGEFEQYVPHDLEDLACDFQVLAEPEGKTRVLGAAVDRDYLEDFLAAWRDAGIDPPVVTLKAAALSQILRQRKDASGAWGVLHVGDRMASLALGSAGGPRALRSISFGADRLAEAVAKQAGVDLDRARETLADANLMDEGGAGAAAAEALGPLADDLRRSLFGYRASEGEEIQRLELAGPLARLRGAAERLEEALGVPVSPFRGLDGMAACPGGAGREADFALAAALGLQAAKEAREINFRRGAFAYKGAGLADRPLVVYLASMGLLIVLLAGFNLLAGGPSGSQVEAMEAETRRLFKEAFPEVTRIVSPVDQAASEMQKLRNKIAVLAPRMSGGLTPLEVLREVSTRIPKETVVDVTELSLDDDKIKIAGVTETSDSFRAIQEALQKVTAFKRVEIFKSDRTADGKVSFELRISMGEGQP